MDLPFDLYGIVKSVHVLAIIAWMAGLLYLPRLFVYHAGLDLSTEGGRATAETFKVMERRLLRAIMNPAMITAWIFGLWMLFLIPGWFSEGWLHAKLLLVVLMTGMHMAMAKWRRDFEADRNARSHVYYRVANEIPTLLLIAIVFLVILKPF